MGQDHAYSAKFPVAFLLLLLLLLWLFFPTVIKRGDESRSYLREVAQRKNTWS